MCTLGIDLDEFAGQPTVAIVVAGGPAHRDGRVMGRGAARRIGSRIFIRARVADRQKTSVLATP